MEKGDVDVVTRPGRMQNLYLSWRLALDERMRMHLHHGSASSTDGRHLFQYLPLMLPLFWSDDTGERELFWPQSAGIPVEALLDRSPFSNQ